MKAAHSLRQVLRLVLQQELELEGSDVQEAATSACFGVLGERATVPLGTLEHALRAGLRAARSPLRESLEDPLPVDSTPLQAVKDAAKGELGPGHVLDVGDVLDGKYRLDAKEAEGGFGRVFRARDLDLDCDVAIKVLKARDGEGQGDSGQGFEQEHLAAFKREAQRLTKLAHPGIVEWKTLNQTAGGSLYLVMEYLDGEELEACLRREGPMEPKRAARILAQVLEALAHAHGLADGTSLLHLDLKPSNVFLMERSGGAETIKVLDFGISRFAGRSGETPGLEGANDPRQAGMTATFGGDSGLACTPSYCSPELALRVLARALSQGPGSGGPPAPRAPLDGRADLYALGVMGYRMLTGRLPFEEETDIMALLERHVREVPAPIRSHRPEVPARLARFVERCLAKDPESRWASAEEAIGELRAIIEPRRLRWILAAGAALTLVGAAALARGRAPAPLAPFRALVGPSSTALEGSRLYLGPMTPEITLRPVGLETTERVHSVCVVDALAPEVPGLSWIEARPAPSGGILLSANREANAHQSTVLLEVTTDAGTRHSSAFELAFLPTAAWTLQTADIPGRNGRAIQPEGLTLEIEVEAPIEWLLPEASVRHGDREFAAHLDGARSTGGEPCVYRFGLGPLARRVPGEVLELCVEVFDRAGGSHMKTITLPTIHGSLRVDEASLADLPQSGATWLVTPEDSVNLMVRASRPARLHWALATKSGAVLEEGRSQDVSEFHTQALGPARWTTADQHLSLRVRLEEHERVMHVASLEGGFAEAELELRLDGSGARFETFVNGAVPRIDAGQVAPTHYLGEDIGTLVVMRDHDTPMVVEAKVVGQSGDAELLGSLQFRSFRAERESLELDELVDGAYRIVLNGQRLDSTNRPLARIDSSQELSVVRDTKGPVLEFGDGEDQRVFRSVEELEGATWRVSESSGGAGVSAPMTRYHWELSVAGRPPLQGHGPWETGDAFSLAVLGLGFAAGLEDGRYELGIWGEDLVGNEGPRITTHFAISMRGPRLRVYLPADGTSWARVDGVFLVELVAEDANGTASISGEFVDVLGELEPKAFELAPPAGDGADSPWTAELDLDYQWSERRVFVRFEGVDRLGTRSMDPVEVQCRLALIPSPAPGRIRAIHRGRDDAPMGLVVGNRNADYLFGGRGDELEDEALERAGMGRVGTGILRSSLQVRVPRLEIADYYLDEHEVTVGQFRRFLEDPASVTEIEDTRQQELLLATAGVNKRLPMTGVSYPEAGAYAKWAGKRLPSYLHWEYAVRGESARPVAYFGRDVDPARINVGSGEPWPVGEGEDVSFDSEIRDLCSNVAEWTVTGADAALGPERLDELLGRAESSDSKRHFAVGGSFARQIGHFAAVRRLVKGQHSPSIGFRCMLPASVVSRALVAPDGQLRIETDL